MKSAAPEAPRGVRGFNDLLPVDTPLWSRAESIMRDLLERWNFDEIRVPVLERSELFNRGIGDATDIVGKEMYSFEDRGGESVSLRPEGTAGVVRSLIEHRLHQHSPTRLWYQGAMFRYERPQKGRYRQFHQLGVEVFGETSALVDAEVVALGYELLRGLGIAELIQVELNSIGCPECRPEYRRELQAYLRQRSEQLCASCRERIEINPLRCLDCKSADCQAQVAQAPRMEAHRCDDCEAHFARVREALEALGIPFAVNSRLVRGLDYYVRTAFEFTTDQLGSQNAVGGGGRYDGLVESIGGPEVPGVGFALGLERVLLLVARQQSLQLSSAPDVTIGYTDEAFAVRSLQLAASLRARGLRVDCDARSRSVRAIFKRGDRLRARHVVLIGEDEFAAGEYTLKRLEDGHQERLDRSSLCAWFASPHTASAR